MAARVQDVTIACAPRISLKDVQELHGWKTTHVQTVALALAPRTLCKSFAHGGRSVFIMWLSP
eukprot:83958-Pyramimonas_sp.AAC.1